MNRTCFTKQRTKQRRRPALRKLKLTLLVLAMSLSTGCATRGAGCSAVPLKSYSTDFNTRLADEITAAPPTAAWPTAILDYAGLRDAVKACHAD